MLLNFESLAGHSRIWIYQSNRKFYENELPTINEKLSSFLETWNNNSSDFKTGFEIKYDRFIIVGVESNENLTTALIDQLVSTIISLQMELEIELLDKLNVCFKQGKFISYKELIDFKKLIKGKAINAKTIVFNNLIETKSELQDNWEIPLADSWHNRFL